MRYKNTSGVTGVSKCRYKYKDGLIWEAKISIDREQVLLKTSIDFFEVVCARKSAEANLIPLSKGGYTREGL